MLFSMPAISCCLTCFPLNSLSAQMPLSPWITHKNSHIIYHSLSSYPVILLFEILWGFLLLLLVYWLSLPTRMLAPLQQRFLSTFLSAIFPKNCAWDPEDFFFFNFVKWMNAELSVFFSGGFMISFIQKLTGDIGVLMIEKKVWVEINNNCNI